MLLDGAFTVLLLLFSGASVADVPPPADVTVSCPSVNVTVSWNYSNQQPQTRFRVNIESLSGYSDTTTEHRFDLSPFIWKSEDHYMDRHYVSVTAIQGGNRSKPVQSKTFSFNPLKTRDIKCELDFPPVEVNVTESGSTVSFRNPLHFYRELQQANKSEGAHFSFSVYYDNSSKECPDCTVKEEICKCGIVFPGAEKCVTLNGSVHRGNHLGEVTFRGTNRICGDEPMRVDEMVLALVLSAFVLVIVVVTILIWKAKAWTEKTPEDLPDFLVRPRRAPDLEYNPVTPIECLPVRPSTVNSEEDNTPIERPCDSGAASDLQPRANGYTDGHLLESSSQEGHGTDNEAEEGRFRAHYDRGHAFPVDFGGGEMVTGYSERDPLYGSARGEEEREEGWEEGRLLPAHYDRGHAFPVDIGGGEMVTGYSERDPLYSCARQLSESSSQEGHGTDNDSADDSVKTECVSMDLEEGEEEREAEEEREEEREEGHYIQRNAL